MINSFKKIWKWLLKIGGEYAKIIVFLGAFSTGVYWLVGPRFTIEVNKFLDEIINPKLNKRDIKLTEDLNVKMSEYMVFSFVEALKDTSFLNDFQFIVESSVDKAVDKKLTSIVRSEVLSMAKEMSRDTVHVLNPRTGEYIGYDIYDIYKNHIIKIDEVRY